MNDFYFDSYFHALLTPIEPTDNLNIMDKLPPIHTLGATHAGLTNIFTSNDTIAETPSMKSIKNEEFCSAELSSSTNLDDNFLEESNWIRADKIPEAFVYEEVNNVADSPISNSISEEDVISSPIIVIKAVKSVTPKPKETKSSPKKKPSKDTQEKKKAAKKKATLKKSTKKKSSQGKTTRRKGKEISKTP